MTRQTRAAAPTARTQQAPDARRAPATAVLLMAYGSPDTLDDVEAYYTDIRGGRPPSPEALAELRERYARIGGRTPLLAVTRELAAGLQAALGPAYRVHVGMRHWRPTIAAAVRDIAAEGARRLVGLPLAPHYSRMSVGAYRQALDDALAALPEGRRPGVAFVERWHDRPAFRRLIAGRVTRALRDLPPGTRVVFTAHSLPQRILAWGDPYPDELRESAAAIAGLAGTADWELAYQSAGRTPEPWLGPSLLDVIDRLAGEGRPAVLVVPFGFTCDHLEVLYDVDVEAQAAARARGLTLRRTPMPNAEPDHVSLLADVVRHPA
jgi:ferrochelatase